MDQVRLSGPRLTLREYAHTPQEVAALHAVLGDPHTVRHLAFEPYGFEDCADQIELYLEEAEREPRTVYRLAVRRRADGEDAPAIGTAALTLDGDRAAQLGFALRRDTWGLGYAGEITGLLCRLGFARLGLHRLAARTDPGNLACARVLTRAGFHREGRIRHDLCRAGRWLDSDQYSLLEHEWRPDPGDPARPGGGENPTPDPAAHRIPR
ncbi:GNAT family N-acetyltransferase [Kitasatospora sp. NPDC048540]|uniref:GNAT family N-acetyltransferase n=1 Tax=Kitasatospora sp. NPDC048540 TaxID=3155634 RepID=UPI0033E87C00